MRRNNFFHNGRCCGDENCSRNNQTDGHCNEKNNRCECSNCLVGPSGPAGPAGGVLNFADLAYTVSGRATGTFQIIGMVIV